MYMVEIDAEKCDSCKACMDACPSGVFDLNDGKVVVVNMQECSGCQSCIELCKTCAVTVTEF